MIAGRLELLLLLFIVVHGKVVTHSGVATNSTWSGVLHAVASCPQRTASLLLYIGKFFMSFSARNIFT